MAGFFSSPGLGFATTGGAFLGGAAKQLNENIEEERKQSRQDDIIWANRFERSLAEYEKEKKDSDFRAKAYNTILQSVGGNKRLADTAFLGVQNNPKDFGNYLNWAIANKNSPEFAQGADYQSNMMDTLQSGLNDKYQNLQNMRQGVRPQAQKYMQMPTAPGGSNTGSTSGSSGGQQNFVGGAGSQVLPAPMGDKLAGSGPSGSPQIPNYSQGPNRQPDQLVNENNNPSLNDQINQAPNAGETPLDQPAVQPAASTTSAPSAITPYPAGVQSPAIRGSNQPAPTGGAAASSYTPFGASKQSNSPVLNPMDPNTWKSFANRPSLEQAMIENGVSPAVAKNRAAGAMTAEELQTQQKALHPTMGMTPEEIANLDLKKKDVDRYLHDPKTGLNAKLATLPDLQRNNQDVSSIVEILNRGFKASAVTPMYDELNRFTSGLLGVSLQDLGVKNVNDYRDVNLMKKDISNGIISRLSTLHFGRITNFEAKLVEKGFTSNQNDPDTNLKIGLMLQNSVRVSMNSINKERDAVEAVRERGGSEFEATRAGQRVAKLAGDEYWNSNNDAPWAKIPLNQNNISHIANLEPGTWFEDPAPDQKGRMYRVVGIDNGSVIIQNAQGEQRKAPLNGR